MKALLTDFDFNKIKGLVHDFGEPEFRALQLYQWINRGVSFENMSNLPKTLTEKLSENFDASGVSINKNFVSKDKLRFLRIRYIGFGKEFNLWRNSRRGYFRK